MKTRRAKIYLPTQCTNRQILTSAKKGSTMCPTSEIVCCLPVFIKLYVIRAEYVHRMSSYHLHFRIEFFIFGLSSFFFGTYLYVSIYIVKKQLCSASSWSCGRVYIDIRNVVQIPAQNFNFFQN